MEDMYYLCFSVDKLPDLTLAKYSVFDGSGVDNVMEKHGVFLRQLHRLGHTSGVYFHLLYYYDPDKSIPKGQHLSIIFYATSKSKEKLSGVREFLSTSVLSNYYEFSCREEGEVPIDKKFSNGAFLTKKDYSLPAQNRLNTDGAGEVPLYSIMEWEVCKSGRLYNVLKLMEGYDRNAAVRIDIFPVEHTQAIRKILPYAETKRRISDRAQGRDDNSENIVRSWDNYLGNLMKQPQYLANITAFAESEDMAVMLCDSIAAEAVESGTYLIETINSETGFDVYESDCKPLHREIEEGNYIAPFLSLFTLEEIRPMFSLPILYAGETVERLKETDPKPIKKEIVIDSETGEIHEVITLGTSDMGYDVNLPVKHFKKHGFIGGVPGAGKTNTGLYLTTTLWRDTQQHIPFLVLEPAKQEYRALAMIDGMEEVCIFSPGADTRFPLHINPFQFPVGLTLAEHIANLNAVFAGAFELIPPSPYIIDKCIEKVYIDKGWNINERNNGTREYPTMQELYDSLEKAVEESGYVGEAEANIRSVMEVRIASLLRREIGNVYNVRESSMEPEEWLMCPAVIELEALGEGPANFMSLLISTLIREALKVRKYGEKSEEIFKKELEHVIFYEEAHNLIGPTTDSPVGGAVDPKISATKYIVKMLAEVRAMGEGIIIADQLPTAMSPEVLKNTGLKLGHRITAQDDRNLLGSTMSATADQLEDQGTFATGQALIFYEDLQKPFKMRVCEWEKGVSKKKYESPSNTQLFERLKNNKLYNLMLRRSAGIMQEKMGREFEALHKKSEKLSERLTKNNAEIHYLSKCIAKLTDEEEHAAKLRQTLEKKQNERENLISHELARLCREYANLYFAYMTLSNNYHIFSPDMYRALSSHVIRFFALFGETEDKERAVLLNETKAMLSDFRKVINYRDISEKTLLSDRDDYKELWENASFIAVLELSAQFAYLNRIRNERDNITPDALREISMQYSALFYMNAQKNNSFEFNNTLVNHFVRFLSEVSKIGEWTYPVIIETACEAWLKCLEIMVKLSDTGRVPDDRAAQWAKISHKMNEMQKRV